MRGLHNCLWLVIEFEPTGPKHSNCREPADPSILETVCADTGTPQQRC